MDELKRNKRPAKWTNFDDQVSLHEDGEMDNDRVETIGAMRADSASARDITTDDQNIAD
jgi:hypothetical protein